MRDDGAEELVNWQDVRIDMHIEMHIGMRLDTVGMHHTPLESSSRRSKGVRRQIPGCATSHAVGDADARTISVDNHGW